MRDKVKVLIAVFLVALLGYSVVDAQLRGGIITRAPGVIWTSGDTVSVAPGATKFAFPAGSASAPSVTFSGDLAQGLWLDATNDLIGTTGLSVLGRLVTTALATPGSITVTPRGTTGATTYTYKLVALSGVGVTAAGAASSTTTGNATLDGTNYNELTWTQVAGATGYRIYRTVGGATQGLISTIAAGATLTVNDTGLAGGGETAPTANTTGYVGIGTATPADSLHVKGDVRIDAPGDELRWAGGVDHYVITSDANPIHFWLWDGATNQKPLTLYNAGNVGVGTAGSALGTSAKHVLALANGVAPTTSPADLVQLWSADSGGIAGRASLHVRDELGGVYVLGDSGLQVTGTDMYIGTRGPTVLAFLTNNIERGQITTAGNFGLGAASFGGSAAKVFALGNGTAPTTSPADVVQLWSADRDGVAGKASLHLRTEDGTSHVFGDLVKLGGLITSYNAIATEGHGLVTVRKKPAILTGQTTTVASVGAITTPNDAADHEYLVTGFVNVTAYTSGTINLQVAYTDHGGVAQTKNITLAGDAGTVTGGAGSGGYWQGLAIYISTDPNTAVTVKTAGTFSATYDVGATITQVN